MKELAFLQSVCFGLFWRRFILPRVVGDVGRKSPSQRSRETRDASDDDDTLFFSGAAFIPHAARRRMPQPHTNAANFEETDALFVWVEKNWAEPCTAAMPKPLHGLCMFAPALMMALVLLALVSILICCESRSKSKQAIEKKETKKSK